MQDLNNLSVQLNELVERQGLNLADNLAIDVVIAQLCDQDDLIDETIDKLSEELYVVAAENGMLQEHGYCPEAHKERYLDWWHGHFEINKPSIQ